MLFSAVVLINHLPKSVYVTAVWLTIVTLAVVTLVLVYPRLLRYQSHRAAAAATAQISPQLREGDLIFHTSQSAQSRAIQLATHSAWSHCGIIYKEGKSWQVFEAVQPVKRTPLADWVARGQGGHFVTKRLRDAKAVLTPTALARLKVAGQPMLGHNYDLYFGWSDDRIYCSELIWRV